MLQLTIFLLALVVIYAVKCIAIARASREIAGDDAQICVIHAEEHYEEALQSQQRDSERARAASQTFSTHGVRRQVA